VVEVPPTGPVPLGGTAALIMKNFGASRRAGRRYSTRNPVITQTPLGERGWG